jgi:hypothetical protein
MHCILAMSDEVEPLRPAVRKGLKFAFRQLCWRCFVRCPMTKGCPECGCVASWAQIAHQGGVNLHDGGWFGLKLVGLTT